MAKAVTKSEVAISWSEEDQPLHCRGPNCRDVRLTGKPTKGALSNVKVVVQEWIRTARELGRPIPAPKGRVGSKVESNLAGHPSRRDVMGAAEGRNEIVEGLFVREINH